MDDEEDIEKNLPGGPQCIAPGGGMGGGGIPMGGGGAMPGGGTGGGGTPIGCDVGGPSETCQITL